MAGRELKEIFPPRNARIGDVKLRVEALSRKPKFSGVTFEARAGEVVGIAGLAGAGRTELLEAIFGAHPASEGRIFVGGHVMDKARPLKSVKNSISLLTEDRKRTGLCLNLSVANNVTLASVAKLVHGGRLQRRTELEVTRGYIKKLHIQPTQPLKPVGRLSGGNQQKTLLARWLLRTLGCFLLDEPTRGVDVAARVEIYRAVNELAEAGAAIVLVSSDLRNCWVWLIESWSCAGLDGCRTRCTVDYSGGDSASCRSRSTSRKCRRGVIVFCFAIPAMSKGSRALGTLASSRHGPPRDKEAPTGRPGASFSLAA
jgi:ABC-type sugar transport system ATPase subunit